MPFLNMFSLHQFKNICSFFIKFLFNFPLHVLHSVYFVQIFNLCQIFSIFPTDWPISWEGLKSGENPQKPAFQIKREHSYFKGSQLSKNKTNKKSTGFVDQFVGEGEFHCLSVLSSDSAQYISSSKYIYCCIIPKQRQISLGKKAQICVNITRVHFTRKNMSAYSPQCGL